MNQPLSPNCMAILLLTAPLIVGRREATDELLTSSEYNRLARHLRQRQWQPSDLIGPDAEEVIALCSAVIDRARLESLLGRGFLLSQAVDRWSARALWIVSRADPTYPRKLKARLKEEAPPLLYGCGEASLMETGGLAVVGSRHVDDALIAYSEGIGRVAAAAGRAVISGGARGVDQAAMRAALEAGGAAVGILADSLERAALARHHREALMGRRLALVSPYDPAAGFNVGHAMSRNKYIYALSDGAVVVNSDFEKGGTWAGAIEQLERLHLVPVFVRNGPDAGRGNTALLRRGARPWPEPRDGAGLNDVLASAAGTAASGSIEETASSIPLAEPLSSRAEDSPKPVEAAIRGTRSSRADAARPPSEELLGTVREILSRELVEPHTDSEVARLLAISRPQAKTWLSQLVGQGVLEELPEPTRYRTARR
jgi:DNA processing protein